MSILLCGGFGERLSPDTCSYRQHSQDGHNYTFWPLRVRGHALRSPQCFTVVSTPPGPLIQQVRVCFHLSGRHLDSQQVAVRTPPTSPAGFLHSSSSRPPHQRGQVHVYADGGGLPGPQSHHRRGSSSPKARGRHPTVPASHHNPAAATLLWNAKLLSPFFARNCRHPETSY